MALMLVDLLKSLLVALALALLTCVALVETVAVVGGWPLPPMRNSHCLIVVEIPSGDCNLQGIEIGVRPLGTGLKYFLHWKIINTHNK